MKHEYSVRKSAPFVDESPIRTALPVGTLPPATLPPIDRPGHAGGTIHDPTCKVDLRKTLDLYVLNCNH